MMLSLKFTGFHLVSHLVSFREEGGVFFGSSPMFLGHSAVINNSEFHSILIIVPLIFGSQLFNLFFHCQMYGLIWLTQVPSKVQDCDVLVMLTSALCHDLDHPGYNNAYQVNNVEISS